MNNDQFDDLKQFIDSRISQSEFHFDEKLNEFGLIYVDATVCY